MRERLWVWRWQFRDRLTHQREAALMWIAWHLPAELVMWVFIRVAASATTGTYADRAPDDVSIMDALSDWAPPTRLRR